MWFAWCDTHWYVDPPAELKAEQAELEAYTAELNAVRAELAAAWAEQAPRMSVHGEIQVNTGGDSSITHTTYYHYG